jgi:5-methylcytosine-specific restriction endonuclease McrA
MKQPCLNCGKVSDGGRCPQCQGEVDRRRNAKQTAQRRATGKHAATYNYQYRKQRAHILATATHCAICQQPFKLNETKTADHIIPVKYGGQHTQLQPAHLNCNIQRAHQIEKEMKKLANKTNKRNQT